MSSLPLDALLLPLVLKATLLLAFAAVVHALMVRRASAASRHLVWTLAVVSLLALPVLSLLVPSWAIPVRLTVEIPRAPFVEATTPTAEPGAEPGSVIGRSEAGSAVTRTSEGFDAAAVPAIPLELMPSAATEPDRRPAPGSLIFAVYLLGVLLLFVRLAVDRLVMRRIARGAEPVVEPRWTELLRSLKHTMGVEQPVALLRSRGSAMPMTWGTRRPKILIPAEADAWPENRKRAVLLHELAHVARRDCLTQILAAVACALYWFHPGVWWAARRLRVERELACDDRVLAAGTRAPEYAGHLLEIARTFRAPRLGTAIAMARPSQLEMRMLAALDTARVRTAPAARMRRVGALATAVLLVPLAAAQAVPVSEEPLVPEPFLRGETAAHLAVAAERPKADELVLGGDAAAGPGGQEVLMVGEGAAAPAPEAAVEPVSSLTSAQWTLASQEGTWTAIRQADTQLQLSLHWNSSTWGRSFDRAELRGLTESEIDSPSSTPVAFRIEREAGRFEFEGSFQEGRGAGHFRFHPNRGFAETLRTLGIERGGQVTDRELIRLAIADVSTARIREFTALGFSALSVENLIELAIHNVTPDYVQTMRSLGVSGTDTVRGVVEMRIHRITPEFVRDLEALGYRNLSRQQLLQMGIHQVTPGFIREVREMGFQNLSPEALVEMRIHRVTPEFIRELQAIGYRNLSSRELVEMRIHRVTPEFIRELQMLGYANLTRAQLVQMRIHRVSPEFIREVQEAGFRDLSVDTLVRMQIHGIASELIRSRRQEP